MKTKYIKSDNCVFCNTSLYNKKHDGMFMCYKCSDKIEKEILKLLQESNCEYKIDNISMCSYSAYGGTNKTTIVKVSYKFDKHIFVRIDTSKILDIRDLNDK